MEPTIWEIYKQLEPSVEYPTDVDRFMHLCEPWLPRQSQFEYLGKDWNLNWQIGELTKTVLAELPKVERIRAAILALSLFIDLLNSKPYAWFPLYDEGDERRQQLDWVIDDLREPQHWSDRPQKFTRRAYGRRYQATVTPFLDEVLNSVLDRQDVDRVPRYIGQPEDEFVPVDMNDIPLPTAQEMAMLGIDSLILAVRRFLARSGNDIDTDFSWEVMAVESFAWSWQFLNQPVGGSREAHWVAEIDRNEIFTGLADNNLWFFEDRFDIHDYWDDPEQQEGLELLFAQHGRGWYDPSAEEYIGRELPYYMILAEVVERDQRAPVSERMPVHYVNFWLRWFELVQCRFPVHHWESQVD